MRIGIFGGTFDPIHYGHLVAAEEARAILGLERILIVPAGQPPHKVGRPITPAEHRVAMVTCAIASNPAFILSRVDLDRPGPHYSVDMVARLRRELDPGEVYLIVGMDSLMDLPTWHEAERLMGLCYIVGVNRPGYTYDLAPLEKAVPGISRHIQVLEAPQLEISSHELQDRIRRGLPIKYQVPEAVEDYIRQHKLYLPVPRDP
jgi:nicotinate-nucleotide adenylyltransferase